MALDILNVDMFLAESEIPKKYEISVIGRFWSSVVGINTYQTKSLPSGYEEVQKIAGDFSEIFEYVITELTVNNTTTPTGTRFDIIRSRIVEEVQLKEEGLDDK